MLPNYLGNYMKNPMFSYMEAIAIIDDAIVYGQIKKGDASKIGVDVPVYFYTHSGKEIYISGMLLEVK